MGRYIIRWVVLLPLLFLGGCLVVQTTITPGLSDAKPPILTQNVSEELFVLVDDDGRCSREEWEDGLEGLVPKQNIFFNSLDNGLVAPFNANRINQGVIVTFHVSSVWDDRPLDSGDSALLLASLATFAVVPAILGRNNVTVEVDVRRVGEKVNPAGFKYQYNRIGLSWLPYIFFADQVSSANPNGSPRCPLPSGVRERKKLFRRVLTDAWPDITKALQH